MKFYKFLVPLLSICVLTGCGDSSIERASSKYAEIASDGIAGSYDYGEMDYDDSIDEGYLIDDSSIKEEKLVYNCDLSIQTLNYNDTISNIKDKINQYNGIIESEREYDSDYDWYYEDYYKSSGSLSNDLTVRIPSKNYHEFLLSLEGDGKIISKESSVENISREYYDVQTVIDSLKIQESRLMDMMNSANTIDDMIAVEKRLTEVQTQLNQYKTQLSLMDNDVNYSTVNINVQEVVEYSKTPAKTNTFFDRLKNTIVDTWHFFWNMLEWLLFLAIRLIPISIIVIPVVILIKSIYKKKKENKNSNETLNNKKDEGDSL